MKDCVSLEIAKKLKEAGFKDPEHLYWQNDEKVGPTLCSFDTGKPQPHNLWGGPCWPAITISELLEALPWLQLYKEDGRGYEVRAGDNEIAVHPTNPADALALLWLALKEKNLV